MTTSPTHDKATDPAVEAEDLKNARIAMHCHPMHHEQATALRVYEQTIDRLASDKARLEGELAKAREWSPNDVDDEWTPAIRAAHPTELNTPEAWRAWNSALEMVGHRRSKYALVDLASWLLARAERAEAERDALKAEQLADANTHAETVHRLYEDLSALKQRVAEVEGTLKESIPTLMHEWLSAREGRATEKARELYDRARALTEDRS